jgi:hypothetical protein
MQAIKALHTGQLQNYLVREHPRMMEELYNNLWKFSKLEVLHFRKLDQQRKDPKGSEASRPTKYNKSREGTLSFDNATKQVHSTDSDGCGPLKNWEKIIDLAPQKQKQSFRHQKRVSPSHRWLYEPGQGRGRSEDRPLYCMYHKRDTNQRTRDCPIFLESKKKMIQKQSQPSNPSSVKEVNHASH